MERRFAVHAGGNTQALICRRARPRAWMVAVALVSIAGVAAAKPKRRDAKAAFDRGLAAYKKGSFEAASQALGKSFELERDVDTLFAWAQSERKLEHCDKAIELYEKLLGFDLPPANRDAVELKRTECFTIVAQQKPPSPPPPAEPPAASPPVEPKSEPSRVDDRAASAPAPAPAGDTQLSARAWYKDPIALGLAGSGIVAIGVGAGFLISARSLDRDFNSTKDYQQAEGFSDKAKSREKLGWITSGVGGALVIGGVVWIVTHRSATEQHALTGWLAPGGGGLAVAGAF
jgi:tetratricopeptide (TPR) repeat protein